MVLRNVDLTSFIIYSIMIGLFQSRVMHILKEKKNIYIYFGPEFDWSYSKKFCEYGSINLTSLFIGLNHFIQRVSIKFEIGGTILEIKKEKDKNMTLQQFFMVIRNVDPINFII